MNIICSLVSALSLVLCLSLSADAATVAETLEKVAADVAQLEIGFGNYTLGKALTADQKITAARNPIQKSLQGTYKFKDGETFVVVSSENDTIIGLYQDYPDTTFDHLKTVIGTLMLEHGEPTTMGHDKLVYWLYDNNGKIEQDAFKFQRENAGPGSLAAVKFSSSEPIVETEQHADEGAEDKTPRKFSAYVMITSDPLSRLFLAANKQEEK